MIGASGKTGDRFVEAHGCAPVPFPVRPGAVERARLCGRPARRPYGHHEGQAVRIRRMEFELLVGNAIRKLPPQYRRRLEGVAVVVEDEPSPAQRQELGLAPRELLFGLYDGVPLTDPDRYSAPVAFPDRIILYQRTFERACTNRHEVEEEIRLTIIHEVGHHFGLDEDHLEHV